MMRKITLLVLFLMTLTMAISAQKLATGGKMPEVKVERWVSPKPTFSTPRLVGFVHSSSNIMHDNLKKYDQIAKKYGDKLQVIVVAKESIEGEIYDDNRKYFAGIDNNGKTFDNFGVQYVPFGVLCDGKGKVVWFGNIDALTEDVIKKALD